MHMIFSFLTSKKFDADSSIHIHNSPVKNFLPKWMDENSAGERSIWLRMSSSLFRSSGLNKSNNAALVSGDVNSYC